MDKGYLYELQIRDHIINSLNKKAFLWKHTPETILINNGIIGSHNENRIKRKENVINPLQDTGIDIIFLEDETKCAIVQCKNGYMKGITMENLAGFMCWMATLDKLNGYVYYTDKLSINVKTLPINKRIQFIKQPYIETKIITDIKFNIDPDKLAYQIIAQNNAKEYYIDNKHGIISMPCGTGKTYTSYLISQMFKQIIIISPLKQFAKQNLDRYIEYGYKYNTMLIDSDGCRDINIINQFIKKNNRFILSATYDSVDMIYMALDNMHKPFFIIDEFHNLSENNVLNDDDIFNKIICTKHRKLFMSATPRIYELEYTRDSYDYIFGETIYHMSFNEAIKMNYITDYTIWLPSIHEDLSELYNELSIYDIDYTIKAKCVYLYSCLINNGSRKCIIYCVDVKEINDMMTAMKTLNQFYYLDLHMDMITSNTTHTNRTITLNRFASSDKLELLFSVRILDECIDIPSCDSIYITYPTKSKIRTIQRLSRCIRIDRHNKYKQGNIFIWCDEYELILETLAGIKEYDIDFVHKIKTNCNNLYGKKNIDDMVMLDNELIQNYIIGIKEFKCISWFDKLEEIKRYIDMNGKRPSKRDTDNDITRMSRWLQHQVNYYKNKKYNMKNDVIYKAWYNFINTPNYKEYFISNEEEWTNKLYLVKKYIDINGQRPPSSPNTNNETRKQGIWIITQIGNYQRNRKIMKNKYIYDMWTKFITSDEYKKFFISNEEKWCEMLIKIKKYIDNNKKKPTSNRNKYDNEAVMASWLSVNSQKYKTKTAIMKNKYIYDMWTEFITSDEYKEYFISNNILWYKNLNKVKVYMDAYNKIPSHGSKNINIKYIGNWLCHQKKNYKTRKDIMKNDDIYKSFTEFITSDKYKKYFS